MKIRNLILGLLACVGSGVAVADELISVELLPNPEMNEDVNADGWQQLPPLRFVHAPSA